MVLPEQVEALIDFVEGRPELALGHCSRTNEGKVLAKRLWSQCANLLNSLSPNCPTKTVAEWRAFFYEYKSRVLRKIKHKKQEISATGGGPSKIISLTPLQERLYTILGRDIGEPLPGVRHEPPPVCGVGAQLVHAIDRLGQTLKRPYSEIDSDL